MTTPLPRGHIQATDSPALPERSESLTENAAARLERRGWPATPIRRSVTASFEFFPPKTDNGAATLRECASHLSRFEPSFMSVTYGAGGTDQERTHAAINDLIQSTSAPIAGHLTAVGASKDEVGAVVDRYAEAGVRHIVALRGDTSDQLQPHPDGFTDAASLVAAIRSQVDAANLTGFDISVAGYPEVHPRAASEQADIDNLKRKVDAGATRVLTQFFFDTDSFIRFFERARAAGIDVPIVPGIMPVWNVERIQSFSARCGTSIPSWLPELFDGLDEAPEVRELVAATVAAEQCRRLAEYGIDSFHFYTMNSSTLAAATCQILGLRATSSTAATVSDQRNERAAS